MLLNNFRFLNFRSFSIEQKILPWKILMLVQYILSEVFPEIVDTLHGDHDWMIGNTFEILTRWMKIEGSFTFTSNFHRIMIFVLIILSYCWPLKCIVSSSIELSCISSPEIIRNIDERDEWPTENTTASLFAYVD